MNFLAKQASQISEKFLKFMKMSVLYFFFPFEKKILSI